MIYSFDPIADKNSRILILGSIPGKESLRKKQYYGHDRNSFWHVMYALFDEKYAPDYAVRTCMLLSHHIALWDVLKSCEREGSLDANIKNPTVNDFPRFFKRHPKIHHVFFNGRAAYSLFKKQVGFSFDGVSFSYLGSTSPAHAISFEKRVKDWRKVVDALANRQYEYGHLYCEAVDASVRDDIKALFKETDTYDAHQLDCLLNPKKYPPVVRLGACSCKDDPACAGVCFYGAISHDQDGNAVISEQDCVGCGDCIESCKTQNLADIKEVVPMFDAINNSDAPVYAMIAPAYISQFSREMTPGKLRSAFKKLGFAGMIEVALFADILTLKEALEFDAAVNKEDDFMLTSCCCPMWVAMIRKVYSQLSAHMPASVSPMVACGRAIKILHPDAVTVFIGPCIAKKAEARQSDISDAVDFVLTFQEMDDIFRAAHISPKTLKEDLRDHSSAAGRIYARTAGVSEAVKATVERLNPKRPIPLKAIQGDGVPGCKALLSDIKNGMMDANFVEGMGCVGGCVGGPRALIDTEKGAHNVGAYAAQAPDRTPVDNAYVLELLYRLGFDTIDSLAEGENMFTRDFTENF